MLFNNGPETHHGDTGSRAGMSFHIYCLTETPTPSPADPVQEQQCAPVEDLPFQRAEEQSRRTGDTLLLSEFGATDDLGAIERILERADRAMVGLAVLALLPVRGPDHDRVRPHAGARDRPAPAADG